LTAEKLRMSKGNPQLVLGKKLELGFKVNEANNFLILSGASEDIEAIYNWYEQRQLGLGDQFMDCLNSCFSALQQIPNAYPVVYKNYRRALVKRFPYAVIYEYYDDIVLIYSVFHSSQDTAK
jgi:plasmid stabilization system protein ParE